MGRAIVRKPQVFLMDEPLSNLDAQLRVQTRTQIAALQRRLGVTTLYVTHDQVEAMTMGDRVAVLDKGRLQQVDTPNNLYARPVNRFVAGFMGSPAMNLREVAIVDGAADLSGYRIPLTQSVLAAADGDREGRVVIGIRPEAFEVVGDQDEGLVVTTEVVEELGSDAFLFASLADHQSVADVADIVARIDPGKVPAKGRRITLRVQPEVIHVFSTVNGARLN
jgi:multiple sugar transport system ATP-binding protein